MKFFAPKGIITVVLAAGLLFAGSAVQAQSTSTDQTNIEALQQQVERLQERVRELQAQLESRANDGEDEDVDTSSDDDRRNRLLLRIEKQLRQGDSGPDVQRLQQLLASDNEVYPEGLVTGYFGPLTKSAVARLQARMGLPTVGNVGPQTLSRVNQLLEEGAGNSGVIPPGLLTAPGIQRTLLGDTSTTTDDKEEIYDNDDDDGSARKSGLDIENLAVPERIKSLLRSVFNKAESRFKDDEDEEDDDEDDEDDDELEIEIEIEDGEAHVKIEYADGSEEEFRFETTDKDEIIQRIVEETDLSEEEIEAVAEFENDDDDEDEESNDDQDDEENEDNI